MDNLFDGIQDAAFDIVTNTMGYTASWTPSTGTEVQTAKVLFKNPTEVAKLNDISYDPLHNIMEYKKGDFEGLKALVDDKSDETIIINSIEFRVFQITSKYDGKTFIADLEQLQ